MGAEQSDGWGLGVGRVSFLTVYWVGGLDGRESNASHLLGATDREDGCQDRLVGADQGLAQLRREIRLSHLILALSELITPCPCPPPPLHTF
jgi:hypothetical protein